MLYLAHSVVGSMEALSKFFLLFFLFSDWLKLNHLRSRIERGFLDIFSRHICSTVKKDNTSDKLRNKFWREKMFRKQSSKLPAEMILDPWNQQLWSEEQMVVKSFPCLIYVKHWVSIEFLSIDICNSAPRTGFVQVSYRFWLRSHISNSITPVNIKALMSFSVKIHFGCILVSAKTQYTTNAQKSVF